MTSVPTAVRLFVASMGAACSVLDAGGPDEDADLDGYTAATDCDDTDADVHPDATELCNGVDDDCDGTTDEDDADDAPTWHFDRDGDGYGSDDPTRVACTQPDGMTSEGGDCDDAYEDVWPGAVEYCNGIDDDCDGLTDEDDAVDPTTWYADLDGDGFGDESNGAEACDRPSGSVADASDCDDADEDVWPGAVEYCNGIDDDCDGLTDEDDAVDPTTWYADLDGDGFGDAEFNVEACSPPDGMIADATDCDDTDPDAWPGAPETCNGRDDDCDGETDEDDASDASTWYLDADGDGWGDPSGASTACDAPLGTVAVGDDCDDSSAGVHPDATETCNGEDDDCDGLTDEDDASDASTWYLDADGDGYGDAEDTTTACEEPSGYVADREDCDDTDEDIHPGADEVCGGGDEDCDGEIDEADASDASAWFADLDGDGYGDADSSTNACEAPTGYTGDATDCDDDDTLVNPGMDELCDGVDTDCDGTYDDSGTATFVSSAGEPTDLSTLLAGSSAAPAAETFSTEGTLSFCEGTWYVNLDVEADLEILGRAADAVDVVLDGAATGTVIEVTGDGLEVSVSSLTITNGDADGTASSLSWAVGGGLNCTGSSTTSSTLTLDDLWITSNSAEAGGGLSAESCTLDIRDTVIDDNDAVQGGGLWLTDCSVDLTGVEIHNNASTARGGGIYARQSADSMDLDLSECSVTGNSTSTDSGGGLYLSSATVVLTNTDVSGNSSGGGGGGAYLSSSDLTCEGSTTADTYGFLDNEAAEDGGSIYISDRSSTLTADTCDFGTSDDGDSTPDDLHGTDSPYRAGNDASFSCELGACGSSSSTTLGGRTSSSSSEGVQFANVVYAESAATLESFKVYLKGGSTCDADLYVLSSDTMSSGDWTVEFSDMSNSISTSGGYVSSGRVNLVLDDAKTYAFAFAYECSTSTHSVTRYYKSTGLSTDAGFGTAVGYLADTYSGGWSSTADVTAYTSPTAPFDMVIAYTEL